jgi:hypothetical protein
MIVKPAHDRWSGERRQYHHHQQHHSSFTHHPSPLFPYEPSNPVPSATATTTNMIPSASMADSEPIPLSSRFAKLKRNMIACRERDVAESFYRLLRELRREADEVAAAGMDAVPTIDYFDIHDAAKAAAFRKALRRRGVAVIKRVIPPAVAQAWKEETLDYMADNPNQQQQRKTATTTATAISNMMMDLDTDMGDMGMGLEMGGFGDGGLGDYQLSSPPPPKHDGLYDLYWSPGQVRARADSRLLEAQRFAMGTWHASDENALVGPEYPVAYADRLRVRRPSTTADAASPFFEAVGGSVGIHVDNGSVERWEPDGYGASGTYGPVFSGRWEDFDPWDSSPRLRITTDLYNRAGSCSMFRMFQGFLSLSSIPAGSGSLTVCPMLQLSTAYLLLRPFFTPRFKSPLSTAATDGMGAAAGDIPIGMDIGGNRKNRARTEAEYLHPNNWNLNVSQTSILHGAVPGYVHEVNSSLHPHLQLHRTMVSIPDIEPGDYVIWHPDAIHDVDSAPNNTFLRGAASTNLDLGSNAYSVSTSSSLRSSSNITPSSSSSSPTSSSSSYTPLNFPSGYSFLPGGNGNPTPSFSPTFPPTMTTSSSTPSSSLSSSSSVSTTTTTSPSPYATTSTKATAAISNPHYKTHPSLSVIQPNPSPSVVLYIPACPLTQTNALYLARQRRSFLLGQPAPDFMGVVSSSISSISMPGGLACGGNGSINSGSSGGGGGGERDHPGRSGVQDVADAGGDEGLRSMGLAPWDEAGSGSGGGYRSYAHSHNNNYGSGSGIGYGYGYDVRSREKGPREREKDARLLRLANDILFPDRFDGVCEKVGGRR